MTIKDKRFYNTIRDFLEIYLIKQKNYSLNTQKSYREAINLLLKFFKEERSINYSHITFEHINYENISEYLLWLEHNRKCSISTVNNRLMAIRSFAKYSSIIDPAKIAFQVELQNISTKKSSYKTVEFLSKKAIQELFNQPDILKLKGIRDRFFLMFMYDLAARCQEMLSIRLRDILMNISKPTIRIRGKGSKIRILPISENIIPHLKKYLELFHTASTSSNDEYLFYVITHGKRHKMSPDAVALFIKKYGKAGKTSCKEMPDRIYPHLLRHSRAMHLYRSGMPLILLSEFLGHANIDTTRIYAYSDTEMKRAAISKATIGEQTPLPIWHDDEELILKLYGL